jgi:hypothetical protein
MTGPNKLGGRPTFDAKALASIVLLLYPVAVRKLRFGFRGPAFTSAVR